VAAVAEAETLREGTSSGALPLLTRQPSRYSVAMTDYAAPLKDMAFTLAEIAGLEEIAALPGYGDATPDLVEQVLAEGGRFAAEVLAPLNRVGDIQGSRLENGRVRTPDGFADAYARFVAAGWNGVPFDPAHGGQGLPWALATALQEMWSAANMAFGLCPLLTQAAVELLQAHGTEAQKRLYLPPLVTGRWAGTMELTEPQAGSDVGALRTRAERAGDHYRITGQKIFITYGDQDFTENIVHMVLARLPDAPPGSKGLSLFLVPKVLVRPDGSAGEPNDLRCVSLEHKLGIRASPTAVMAYGDNGGAIGTLVGEENRGLEAMFTMMNNARLAIGVQGLGIAERAYQQARAYAAQRVQGRLPIGGGPVPIIRHPDVRRMLMTMRAHAEAIRALLYYTAGCLDRARRHPDPAERVRAQARLDLLIPVAKAWSTDRGCESASLGIQVHGGLGFIEETGAAQHYRDARIAPIYEGTNGIQAGDLLGRKLMRDGGAAARAFFTELRETTEALAAAPGKELASIGRALAAGTEALTRATDWLVETGPAEPLRAFAGATPYLTLFGTVTGGWLLAKAALAAQRRLAAGPDGDAAFLEAKRTVARFYAENILPQSRGLAAAIIEGGDSVLALPEEQL
jgi:alkylation response protein AidB-like acyl-CoA dehydrogenase